MYNTDLKEKKKIKRRRTKDGINPKEVTLGDFMKGVRNSLHDVRICGSEYGLKEFENALKLFKNNDACGLDGGAAKNVRRHYTTQAQLVDAKNILNVPGVTHARFRELSAEYMRATKGRLREYTVASRIRIDTLVGAPSALADIIQCSPERLAPLMTSSRGVTSLAGHNYRYMYNAVAELLNKKRGIRKAKGEEDVDKLDLCVIGLKKLRQAEVSIKARSEPHNTLQEKNRSDNE